ncbi:MAG: GHKL domain-containing protein [Bacteroidetes bacterium]|nr:GHKL domain-containing protein [Bacteroidota bacterium]
MFKNNRSLRLIKLKAIIILFLASSATYSQNHFVETGIPFIHNYTPEEYKAHNQNFSIVADNRDVMYFGNFAGILEYDGSEWQIIQTDNKTRVTALNKDNTGRLLIGSYGEFGLLCPDSIGNMIFINLSDKLEEKHSSLEEVFNILVTGKSSWFVTESAIFQYQDNTVSVIEPETNILAAYSAKNKLFCLLKTIGLCELVNSRFIPIKGCELFSETVEIKAVDILGENKYLIATSNNGLFIFDGIELTAFNTPANDYLKNNIISCGLVLSDKSFAYGTERGGIVILHPDGHIKEIITEGLGLNDNYVRYLYVHGGALWAALNNGLARIETPSPITYDDIRSGLYGGVTDVLRNKNILYVATYNGLFYQDNNTARFVQINDINTGCWALASSFGDLFVASSAGVYIVKGSSAYKINHQFALTLHPFRPDSSIIFVGHTEGLAEIKKKNGQWKQNREISNISNEIREISAGDNNTIWLSTTSDGLIRYFTVDNFIEKYDTTNGLPSMMMNKLNMTSYGLIITTIDGLYKFDKQDLRFKSFQIPGMDTLFNKEWHKVVYEDGVGNIWSYEGDETHIKRYMHDSGRYINNSKPFGQIENNVIWSIYSDENEIIWLGGPDGLFRYNPKLKIELTKEFFSLIRKVTTAKDSVLFLGNYIGSNQTAGLVQNKFQKPILSSENNNMHFVFTACTYNYKTDLNYQIRLFGFEDEWSEWTSTNKKEYTNLPPGNYIFCVRAKDVFGQISTEAKYEFTILTPWYMKWWAYVLYVTGTGFVVVLIVIWRSQKLIKEKKKLEIRIKERTTEIVDQKEEIEKQSFELASKNKELEKINLIVKAINSEIIFTNLLQSILEKTRIIKGVDKAMALVYDEQSNSYKFKASFGWELSAIEEIELSLDDAEKKYLGQMEEIYEDIFFTNNIEENQRHEVLYALDKPKCMLVIVVKIENKTEGFLIMENIQKTNAFTEEDFSFVKNLKEHIISAFIKTKILEDLQKTLENLKETQEELIRQEKLASVGQLTKGIVDRVINPLNYIKNFSILTGDMITEINEVVDEEQNNMSEHGFDEISEITGLVSGNMEKIKNHGENAARIVKGMERLLKDKSNNYVDIEVNIFITKILDVLLKEMESEILDTNIKIHKELSIDAGRVNIMYNELGEVLKAMLDNALYIFRDNKKGILNFEPAINISTVKTDKNVEIRIKDNGIGMSQLEIDKIFDPFFTTKPTADGTGLGLYLCKDIVEIHNGNIKVNSKEGEFTEFIITLPSVTE